MEAANDFFSEVFSANDVSARLGRGISLIALGENGDDQLLARTVRQGNNAANGLIRLLGIDAEVDGDFQRLDELALRFGGVLLDQLNGIREGIGLFAVDVLDHFAEFFTVHCHLPYSTT